MTKKILSVLFALLLSLSLFSGCSSSGDKEIDADALYSALKTELTFKDELIDMDMSAIMNFSNES